MDVSGAGQVLESFVDQIGETLHKADYLAAAHLFGGRDQFANLREVWNVCGRLEEFKMFLAQIAVQRIQFGESGRFRRRFRKIVRQDDRFSLDFEPLMFAKDIELINRISERVLIS